jgi:hypothetical protein
MFGKKKKKEMDFNYQMEQKDKRIYLLMLELSDLKTMIAKKDKEADDEITTLRDNLEEIIKENQILVKEIAKLIEKPEHRTIGFMPIETPIGFNEEKAKEFQKIVITQMETNMKRIGLDIDLVAMPSVVKNIQIVTLDMKKKEEQK